MIRSTAKYLVAAAMVFSVMGSAARADLIYGLNETGTNVFEFDSAAPTALISGHALTGLAGNEQIAAIDVQPTTGTLFGLGTFGNLYTINAVTGAASNVGTLSPASLNGVNFDIDFNPTTSTSLRSVSDAEQNLSINPATAATTVNGSPTYALGDPHFGGAANLAGIAYSNNVPGAGTTTLFGIDSGFDTLATLNGTTGTLFTVGSLGINVTAVAGFDISAGGTAFAALEPANGSVSNLYTINTATGAATLVGQIGGGFVVRDIAVVEAGGSVPEPASLATVVLGGAALLARRRRRA